MTDPLALQRGDIDSHIDNLVAGKTSPNTATPTVPTTAPISGLDGFIDGLVSKTPTVPTKLTDATRRASAEGPALPKDAVDAQKGAVLAESLSREDWPTPKNFLQAHRGFAKYNVHFDASDTPLWNEAMKIASAKTWNTLAVLQLWDPKTRTNSTELTDATVNELTRAYAAQHMAFNRGLTDEERPAVQEHMFRGTMAKVETEGLTRLTNLKSQGKEDTAEFLELTQLIAQARSLRNQPVKEEFRREFGNIVKREHEAAKAFDTNVGVQALGLGAERESLARLWEVADGEKRFIVGGRGARVLAPSIERKQSLLHKLINTLRDPQKQTILSDFFVKSGQDALISQRHELLGITPEESDQMGSHEMLRTTHPNVHRRLMMRSMNAIARKQEGLADVGSTTRSVKAYDKRIKESLSAAVEVFSRALPLQSPARQASAMVFDPTADSTAEAFADAGSAALSHIAVSLRAAQEFFRRGLRSAGPDLTEMRDFSDRPMPRRTEKFLIPRETLMATTVQDIQSGRVPPEQLKQLDDPTIKSYLRESVQFNNLTFAELSEVLGDDLDLAHSILKSPAMLDTASRIVVTDRQKGFPMEAIKADVREGIAQVMQDIISGNSVTVFGNNLGTPEGQAAAAGFARQNALKLNDRIFGKGGGEKGVALEAINYLAGLTEWGAHIIAGESKRMAGLVVADPKGLGSEVVVGLAFEPFAGPVVAAGLRPIRAFQGRVRTFLTNKALTREFAAGMSHSPSAVQAVQRELKSLKLDPETAPAGVADAVLDRADALTDSLAEINRLRSEDVEAGFQGKPTDNVVQLTEATSALRRNLKGADTGTLQHLLKVGGATDEYLNTNFIQKNITALGAISEAVGRKMGFYGTKAPTWITDNQSRVFRAMTDAMQDGTLEHLRIEDMGGLLSHRAADKIGQGRARIAADRFKAVASRKARRGARGQDVMNELGSVKSLGDYTVIADWFTNVKSQFQTWRELAVGKRNAANSFLNYMKNGRIRRANERAIYGADPEPAREAARRAEGALAQSRDVDISLSVKFDKHPVLDDVNLDDIMAWAGTQSDAFGDLFSRMSRPEESRTAFTKRLEGLSPEDFTAFKEKFAREYLNSPDITSNFGHDLIGGSPLSEAEYANLRGQRQAARRELVAKRRAQKRLQRLDRDESLDFRDRAALKKRYEADLAEAEELFQRYSEIKSTKKYLELLQTRDKEAKAFGLTTSNIGDSWKDIAKLADLEDTNEVLGVVQRMGTERSGDFNLTVADVQGAAIQNKALIAAHRGVAHRLTLALSGQSDEFRDLFRKALRAQEEEGDFLTMQELRDKNPGVFEGIPEDYSKNIEYLLTKDKDMRRTFGRILLESGAIDENEYAKFTAPYIPRRYEVYDSRYEIARLQDDQATAPGPIGMTADELEARREIGTKWRLIVRARNSAPTEALFANRSAAEAHLRKNFSTEKFKGDGDFAGETATGDRFQVLAPISREKADLLSPIPDDAALAKSWWELGRTASSARVSKLVDRPGLAFDEGQWDTFKKTDQGRAALNDYTAPIKVDRRFGSLSGKRLHKDAWAFLQDSMQMVDDTFQAFQAVQKAQDNQDGFLARAFGQARTGLGNMAKLGKQFVTSQIIRSPTTHMVNLLSDYSYYGRAATDSGWHFTGRAMEASREAFDLLFPGGQIDGNLEKVLRKLPEADRMLTVLRRDPDFEDMMRFGIIDDSLAGVMLHGDGALAMRELIYGEADSGTGLRAKLSRGQFFRRKVSGADDSPATKALRKRVDQIQKAKDSADWDKLSSKEQLALANELEDKTAVLQRSHRGILDLGEAIDGLSWLSRAQTGRPSRPRGLGAFRDHSALSAEIYQRWSNYMRVRAYKYNRKRGLTPALAAERVNKFMQTYSGVPTALKDASNSFFGSPVLSFPYEFVRTGYHTMTRQPGLFAGLWGAMPVANMFALGMSGADPEKVLAELGAESGGLPAWTALTSGMLIPDQGGHFKFAHVPWMDALQLFRATPGIVGDALGGIVDPETAGGAVVNAGVQAANRLVANNPAVNFAASLSTGRDSMSGRRFQSRTDGALETLKQVGRVAIPPMMPGVPGVTHLTAGRVFGTAVDTARKPGNKVSGRTHSVLDKFLSGWLGVRLRGVWEEGHFEPLARTVLFLGGDPKWKDRPLRGSGAFSDADLKAGLVFQSRRVDPDAQKMEFSLDLLDRDLRGALQNEDMDSARRILQKMRDRGEATTIIGDSKLVSAMSDEEIMKEVSRAVDVEDFDNVFRGASVHQKAWMLSTYAALADTPEQVEDLKRVAISTAKGDLSSSSSPTQIERGIQTTGAWLDQARGTTLDPERIAAVEQYQAYLRWMLPQARLYFMKELHHRRATSDAHGMLIGTE